MRRVLVACLLVPSLASAGEPSPPNDPAPSTPAAGATEPTDTPAPAPISEPTASSEPTAISEPTPASAPPASDETATAIDELFDRTAKLQREHRTQAGKIEQLEKLKPLARYINVFVDVGAFAVAGNGSGIRTDIANLYFPKYKGRIAGQWVFMGDPLSTAINTNGEPSDTSTSREIQTDTINSEGKPSLVVNAVGLSIGRDIGDGFSVAALAELLPRPEHSILDVELASVDYRPLREVDLLLSAGKVDSVLGVEYRNQDAPRRLGITPSLICRYTCGRPLGLRARLVYGRLSTSATLTNGDNFQRIFEPTDALKYSPMPTAAAHVQWMLPVGQGLEIGMSGAYGPQDAQPDTSLRQWHLGFDARLRDLDGFDAVAEYVQGRQPGRGDMVECDLAPCLTYKGAYLLVDRRLTNWFTPYVRADWRSAVHIKGTEFVYESHTFRTTLGAQFAVTDRILGKLEYTYNRELGGIPQFPDDVVTTSIVVFTD